MPKHAPLHQIIESSIQADDLKELIRPETVVWAKLRGYPWWPGRVLLSPLSFRSVNYLYLNYFVGKRF